MSLALSFLVIVLPALVIGLVIQILFLANLQNTLNRVSIKNRAMPAGHVWLNLVPVFGQAWFIYTVIKVRDSLRAEYRDRGWLVDGDFGHSIGLAAGILAIISLFFRWIPRDLALAELVLTGGGLACWIIYWVKIARVKNRLRPAPILGSPWRPPSSALPGTPPLAKQVGSCAECGTSVGPEDRFCWKCGSRLH